MFEVLRFYGDVLWRALLACPSIISSNWPAVVFSVFGATYKYWLDVREQFRALANWRERLRAMKETKNIWNAVKAVILACFLLFAYSLIKTIHDDHVKTIETNSSLTTKNQNLVSEKEALEKQIEDLNKQINKYKNTPPPRSAEYSAVGIYAISHDLRPGMPKREYVMTTRKMRSPVQITATCDFPISEGSVTFLKPDEMGGSAQTVNSQRMSEKQFRFLILSPVWSESLPLLVTVFFEGKVDRMPLCQFRVE